TQLVVTTQPPRRATVGAGLGLVITAEDPFGNVDTSFAGNVAVALKDNPGSASLGGTTSVTASEGSATFSGLTISAAGSGYTLPATTPGLTPITTSAITVTAPGVATQLVVTGQPPTSVAAGDSFGLTVKAEDDLGTVDASFNGPVTVSAFQSFLGGVTTVNAV